MYSLDEMRLETDRRKYLRYLQEDLRNERMHCLFYQQAAAIVCGLHREEFREFFLAEAASELNHIDEFATMIVYLGGVPETHVAPPPKVFTTHPSILFASAQKMETDVAANYALRMAQTGQCSDQMSSYLNLFYEDQLQDSQKAAFELRLFSEHYHIDNKIYGVGINGFGLDLSDEELEKRYDEACEAANKGQTIGAELDANRARI